MNRHVVEPSDLANAEPSKPVANKRPVIARQVVHFLVENAQEVAQAIFAIAHAQCSLSNHTRYVSHATVRQPTPHPRIAAVVGVDAPTDSENPRALDADPATITTADPRTHTRLLNEFVNLVLVPKTPPEVAARAAAPA